MSYSYTLNSETTDNCIICGDIDDFCDGNESEKICKHCLDHCCEECFTELESPEEESKHICKDCDEDSEGKNVFENLMKIVKETEKKVKKISDDDYDNSRINKALKPLVDYIKKNLKKLDKKDEKNYDENMERLKKAYYMSGVDQAISDTIYDHFGEELIDYI